MKQFNKLAIILTAFYLVCSTVSIAQNVGIGTPTPSEKLDVNGNINLNGQLKANGNAGTQNQVLMKDAANNLAWGDISEFKNLQFFDCNTTAVTAGTNNCTASWTVPTGVTNILIECWGGGGGGGNATGGASGGYVSAKLIVTPGSVATLTIGAAGNYGSTTTTGVFGGTTSFTIAGTSIIAYGGRGGNYGDPQLSLSGIAYPDGGSFFVSGIANQYIGFYGNPGEPSKLSFMPAGTNDFAKIVNYGNGGDAPFFPGSGGKGGYSVSSANVNQTFYAPKYGIQCGAGGGSDVTGGYFGRGGRIIVRW